MYHPTEVASDISPRRCSRSPAVGYTTPRFGLNKASDSNIHHPSPLGVPDTLTGSPYLYTSLATLGPSRFLSFGVQRAP